jgi:D-alanyl-D-alanine carboxypeptidase/D-alanyl-D-alanine-endopeptidase (penicillin-binding protein 4)
MVSSNDDESPAAGMTPAAGAAKKTHHPGRLLTVTVSVVLTLALGVAYVIGDAYDVLPGSLTLTGVSRPEFTRAQSAFKASTVVGQVEEGKTVDSAAATSLMNSLLSAEGVGSDISVLIGDGTGKTVVEHNSGTAREPASTLKTLTAFTASSVLDMNSTLDTEVYLDQSKGTSSAKLVLKGNGDMLLGEGANDSDHINGRAGLGTLAKEAAQALAARGISTVELSYDDSLFGTDRKPSGIEENDAEWRYFTPVSSMAVDGGRQWTDVAKGSDPDVESGYPTRSTQTASDTAQSFAQQLRNNGITVTGSVSTGTVPSGISALVKVSSAKLSEIMAFMLRNSDNTEAELLGRLSAIKLGTQNSSKGAVQAVEQTLSAAKISTAGLQMADCSGLTPGSTVSVKTLDEVQYHFITVGNNTTAAAEGMSIVGLVGTAAKRGTSASANGLLRVKTGTLSGVTSMAGNVSRESGGVLTFAVIINNPENEWSATQAINAFITKLPTL